MTGTKRKRTTDAVQILYERYIQGDPDREREYFEEGINLQIAGAIYDMRKKAGLSQQQLAELVGTTQSVISRLEDSDYDGHSLTMLDRIARALGKKLTLTISDP